MEKELRIKIKHIVVASIAIIVFMLIFIWIPGIGELEGKPVNDSKVIT